MCTFQNEVLEKFRCFLTTPELGNLSNRLLIVDTAIDNPAVDGDTEIILINELDAIFKGFVKSDYQKRIEVLTFISKMRDKLL